MFAFLFTVHMKEEVIVMLAVVFVAFFNQMLIEVGYVLKLQIVNKVYS